jgi:hypothetical protein
MITIIKQPYICSLTKNAIDFTAQSNLYFETATVKPFIRLLFEELPAIGTTYRFAFTNPENGNRENIDLVAVDGTNAENYLNLWQIPGLGFGGTLAEFRTIMFEKLQQRFILNAFYDLEFPIIEFPGSTPSFIIRAKEAIQELVIEFTSNQPDSPDKYISEVNSIAYHQPGVRDGYELKASLFLETQYNSGNFDFVTSIDCVLDENSISHVDVSKYIDAEIEASWREYPVPFEQTLGYIAPNLRRYYVQFSETFTNETQAIETTSETLYVHWGGASSDDSYTSDLIAAQNTSGNWLTWWPSGKRILKEQSDWLAWMNGAEEKVITIEIEFNQDGEVYKFPIHENITLQPFETFIFNSGLYPNLGEIQGVKWWRFNLLKDNEGFNSIKISFNYEGESYEFIIPKYGFVSGRPWYRTGLWNIQYTGTRWQASTTFITPIPLTVFEIVEDDYFPIFDAWINMEGLVFTEFTTSSVIESIVNNSITYYPEKACLTKQIVYFNSFGIPESFILSANWQQNITTSQELATRTESYALDTLYPQNYIFDSKALISYQAETMMLKNLEAERLMPLINSTITFLLENGNFIPVIINAGTTAVYQVNAFLQKIQLDLVQANESNRVSYFETLPDFEVLTTNSIGFLIIYLKRNLLNITNFGSITIYKDGVQLAQPFTYVPEQQWYTGTAITTEGILTLELNCGVNYVQKVVRKQFNYKWDELRYEVFAMENDALVRFSSLYSGGTPMRIDWSDGTVDDVTVTTGTVFTKTYTTNGKKMIRISKPSFFDITQFTIQNASNNFDFSKFDRLSDLIITNCAAGNYYLTTLDNLQEITFINTTIYQLNIGYQKDLLFLILNNSNISADNFELLIREIWNFRKSYDNTFEIRITSEVVVNSVAQAIIDGTGAYAGDGLADYGITLINI